jgi:hypothetical protein
MKEAIVRHWTQILVASSAVVLIAGCGSTTYTFDAPPGHTGALEYYQGTPTLYSQGDRSIVAVRPASRTLEEGDDLTFHVTVTNTGDRPFDLSAEAVSMDSRDGEYRTQSAYSFDEYAALKKDEGSSGFGLAAMTLAAVAGGVASSYGSYAGDMNMMSQGSSWSSDAITNMQMMDQSDKVISEEIAASDQVYLHRTTVYPENTHGGLVSFGKMSGLDDEAVTVRVALPEETHTLAFTIAAKE